MTTSEPTTARDTNVPTTENIAKVLRVCFEKTCACSECPFEHEPCGDIEQLAADRLESQEQTIDELEDECGKLKMTINLLTARAEQAELARDILCGTIRDMEEPKTVGSSTFTIERRGLPQDGEGKI